MSVAVSPAADRSCFNVSLIVTVMSRAVECCAEERVVTSLEDFQKEF